MTAVCQQNQFRRWICCCQTFLQRIKIGLADSLSLDADKRAKTETKAKRRAELAFDNLKLAANAVVIAANADVRLKTQL
jgi:hypothetical protein